MNTMRNGGGMVTMRKDGTVPYDEMGYVPPPNRKLPPVPGTNNSNYNTIDRIKKGKTFEKFKKLHLVLLLKIPFNVCSSLDLFL